MISIVFWSNFPRMTACWTFWNFAYSLQSSSDLLSTKLTPHNVEFIILMCVLSHEYDSYHSVNVFELMLSSFNKGLSVEFSWCSVFKLVYVLKCKFYKDIHVYFLYNFHNWQIVELYLTGVFYTRNFQNCLCRPEHA